MTNRLMTNKRLSIAAMTALIVTAVAGTAAVDNFATSAHAQTKTVIKLLDHIRQRPRPVRNRRACLQNSARSRQQG